MGKTLASKDEVNATMLHFEGGQWPVHFGQRIRLILRRPGLVVGSWKKGGKESYSKLVEASSRPKRESVATQKPRMGKYEIC